MSLMIVLEDPLDKTVKLEPPPDGKGYRQYTSPIQELARDYSPEHKARTPGVA